MKRDLSELFKLVVKFLSRPQLFIQFCFFTYQLFFLLQQFHRLDMPIVLSGPWLLIQKVSLNLHSLHSLLFRFKSPLILPGLWRWHQQCRKSWWNFLFSGYYNILQRIQTSSQHIKWVFNFSRGWSFALNFSLFPFNNLTPIGILLLELFENTQ